MEKLMYIILINYNGFEDTCECLDSICDSDYQNYRVLIIDNNSQDGSGKMIQRKFPQHEYIFNDDNIGFAAANNIGYKYALSKQAEYILLLNNDTVIDKQMISNLVINVKSDTVVVPKMYYYDNKDVIWFAGGEILYNKGTVKHLGEHKVDSDNCLKKNRIISFATGCCMLIHKDILNKIGLFDENYFMYCEDFDFSIRLKQNSYKILFCHKAKLWHKVNSSTKNSGSIAKYYLTRNRFYLLSNNKNYFNIISIIYSYLTRIILFLKDTCTANNSKIYVEAWLDYKRGHMGRKSLYKKG